MSLPDGWRAVTADDASAVAALIDEDEVFAGFRSRLGSDDVAEWTARTNLETDRALLEQDGRIVAAGAGQAHAGSYFARGCVRPSAKGIGLGLVLVELQKRERRGTARHASFR